MMPIKYKTHTVLIFASFSLAFFSQACSNNTQSGPTTTSSTDTFSAFTFNVNMPAYPNKKFSAYIFQNGTLKGAVLSNNVTDGSGKLTAKASSVDANNCVLSANMSSSGGGSYIVHYRLDSTGSASYVYPNGCPSTAGFLSDAGLGMDFVSSGGIYSVTALNTTYQVQFNISGTALNAVSRQTYCSLLDSAVPTPSINISSTMGFAQGAISYTSGGATAITTARVTSTVTGTLSYACWIDFNNSGTYNTGDLVASGQLTSVFQSVSSWTSVP